jgi:drug/metabolite transporter (DMT)-like permease
VAFLLATRTTHIAVTGVLASLYPAVTVLLAAVLLRERVRPGQTLGLAGCGASVCLVALG